MSFDDLSMPATEHSAAILAGAWPAQSVSAWKGYAQEFSTAAQHQLFPQLEVQYNIRDILTPMSGAFIDAVRQVEMARQYALMNRIAAYRDLAAKAKWAANELEETKRDLVEIVNKAEEDIQKARTAAEQEKAAKALIPGAAEAVEAALQTTIATIVSAAKAEALARNAEGMAKVVTLAAEVRDFKQPYANMMLPQTGSNSGSACSTPQATTPSNTPVDNSRPIDGYGSNSGDTPKDRVSENRSNKDGLGDGQSQKTIQESGVRGDKSDAQIRDASSSSNKAPSSMPSAPAASAPSSGGGSSSGASSPASMIGQMMRPMSSPSSSGGSAASSGGSPLSSAGGMPGGASQAGGAGSGAGAGAGGAGSAAAASRAVGAAASAGGMTEASARMGTGAVSAAAGAAGNAVGAASAAAGAGSQLAQTAAAVSSAAGSVPPAAGAVSGGLGGAPMSVMPAAAAGGGVVAGGPPAAAQLAGSNVGPGVPSTPPVGQGPVGSGSGPGAAGGGGGGSPVFGSPTSIRSLGQGGATGEELFEAAVAAGRVVIELLVAQTRAAAHIPISYAVSLIWERSGRVTAWMASSEGQSYIPLGVRVPEDVLLAVADPVGRSLWDECAQSGVADPLEVVVRHAQLRCGELPGSRVLVVASSLPLPRVIDWAATVGAQPVGVDPRVVDPAAARDLGVPMLHRCAAAMPWEWRQANAFTERERLQVASRHMRMAAVNGRLNGRACELVMRLFEERKPIDAGLWADVQSERAKAMVAYQLAATMHAQGGGQDPVQAFKTARAAEVIQCLEHFDSVEGCADLLYATRLAGVPLNPALAVA